MADLNKNVNTRAKYKKYLVRTLIVALIFLFVSFLLSNRYWITSENKQFSGTYKYTEQSWIYKKGDEILESELKVPAFRKMEKGVTYSISTKLTYNGEDDRAPTCFFFVDHMHCKVYLSGEEIFNYTPENIEKHDKSKSPGNVYVSAELPNDCIGKELTIEFIPSLDANIDYQLPNPVFSDYATHMSKTFWVELPHNLLAVLTLFLGFSCIFYSTIAMAESNYREGIFIGLFAILFGLYNITESDFDFYMISNPYHTYVLDYITFTLVPIALLAFLRERLTGVQRKISLGFIIADIFLFFTEMILHFSGIMDMREFLPVIHVSYFVNFIVNFILVVSTKNNHWKRPLILQLIPIICGMILDVAVYYLHLQLGSSDSTFTSIGVVLFLIFEIIYVWRYSVKVYTESVKSREYQEMAYIDAMTGIGNRRAFDIEKDSIDSGKKPFENLTVISADLNNLKVTNDKLGHASGDFIIRSTANVLSDLVANRGSVYRIGGDEFVAFLYNVSEEELSNDIAKMYESIESINAESNAKIDLAIGVKQTSSDVLTALEEADRNMYADKDKRKAN